MNMKILHTADWHLGQSFFDYDRKAEHAVFLTWLGNQIRELDVDVLLIAGDVFDSPNPSAESQYMFYRFLRDMTSENQGLQIIVIAGNHDSAARLEAPDPLLEGMRVAVRGVVRRTDKGGIDFKHLVVPLLKGGCCLAVPYLRQGDYPEAESYAQGVRRMYEAVYESVKGRYDPVIAMGHLQATGSEVSECDRAERTVIGGLECVAPEAFSENIAYTALGHLHRAQRVSGRDNVRYAGAPLPMSFAEKYNRQGVTLVELTGEGSRIERIDFEAPVKLLSVPDSPLPLDEAMADIERLPEGEVNVMSPFLEIKIRISEPEPSLRHRVEEALRSKSVRLARIVAVTPGGADGEERGCAFSFERLQRMNPMDIAADIFRRRYGGEVMPERLKGLLQEVIREVEV
jgi:exonuclease SbcD